jgi:hypothetical protein
MACGLLFLAGCPPYSSLRAPQSPGAVLSERSTWRADGDLDDVNKAIDGNILTIARSTFENPTANLTIDLGKPCVFNRIIIEHGQDEFGYCDRFAVLTSMDGRNYTQQTEMSGVRKVTNVVLVTPVMARYVRLQVTVPGPQPWAVAEVIFQ